MFKVGQILVTQQNAISLAANNIGMYLMDMNEQDTSRYRIIDDFSISFAHDSRGSTATKFLTNIQASIDPLIVRVSLRDIRLALGIFNRANELYMKHQGVVEDTSNSEEFQFSKNFKRGFHNTLRVYFQHIPMILIMRLLEFQKVLLL